MMDYEEFIKKMRETDPVFPKSLVKSLLKEMRMQSMTEDSSWRMTFYRFTVSVVCAVLTVSLALLFYSGQGVRAGKPLCVSHSGVPAVFYSEKYLPENSVQFEVRLDTYKKKLIFLQNEKK